MKAKHEDTRPKLPPPGSTAAEPNAAPKEAKARGKRLTGHPDPDERPYVLPANSVTGGRVMVLGGVQVNVRLDDPFFDYDRYPLEMSFAEFRREWMNRPDAGYVASEYERLNIAAPKDIAPRCLCSHDVLVAHYRALLMAARDEITAELDKLPVEADANQGSLL